MWKGFKEISVSVVVRSEGQSAMRKDRTIAWVTKQDESLDASHFKGKVLEDIDELLDSIEHPTEASTELDEAGVSNSS